MEMVSLSRSDISFLVKRTLDVFWIYIIILLELSLCCPKTECLGRGKMQLASFPTTGTDYCSEQCVNHSDCRGFWYQNFSTQCKLFGKYNYNDYESDRFFTCDLELWSEWTETPCSVTCGTGYTQKSKYCCGQGCGFKSEYVETYSCDTNITCFLPVHGKWATWGSYTCTACSVTCGVGIRTRTRTCSDPAPQNGGSHCTGSSSQCSSCQMQSCPIDGRWSSWGSWGTCNVTCDGGYRYRIRSCSNPLPQLGGTNCSGDEEQLQVCNPKACPGVFGEWSQWSNASECSVTCGIGIQIKNRTCEDPWFGSSNVTCIGKNIESKSCDMGNCPIDGSWSSWGSWEACSDTCGSGIQYRYRSCTSPSPSLGGQDCVGSDSDLNVCNYLNCPVDGAWSPWSVWGGCNVTCGGGSRTRSRTCSDPSPQYNGSLCFGPSVEFDDCNYQNCIDNTSSGAVCQCLCNEQNITLEDRLVKIKTEMTVDTSELSSSKRKLTCAEDDRTTARQVGFVGSLLLCICGFLIISGDMFAPASYICAKNSLFRSRQ